MLDDAASGTSRSTGLLLLLVVLLGLGLRLFHLDHQSLRDDEIFSVALSHMPLHEMWHHIVEDFVHPPLHYLLLHFWFKVVGFGPYQARMLSVIFGTLTIVFVYLIGNSLFGRRSAILAALLLAVSQRAVMTSQDARPYAQLLLVVSVCIYVFIIAIRTGRAGPWWMLICMTTLAIYTHYYGAFAIVSLMIFCGIYQKRYRISAFRLIGGALTVVVLYLPWLTSGIIPVFLADYAKGHTGNVSVHWWTLFTIVNEFNNGRIWGFHSASTWSAFILGILFFSLPAVVALIPLTQEPRRDASARIMRENLVLLLLLSMVPTIAALIIGKFVQPYHIRYIIFVAAPYYLLVALGLTSIKSAPLRRSLIILGACYCAFALRANYFIPYIEDYRDAYDHIAQKREPGDCYVGTPAWESYHIRWAWAIYHGELPPMTLSKIEDLGPGRNSCSRVWVISVTPDWDPGMEAESEQARSRLAQMYEDIDPQRYYWVSLDLYRARDSAVGH
jgi:4-amino-4-deoxy-L-arabinose transferase-like glycosyltransferase